MSGLGDDAPAADVESVKSDQGNDHDERPGEFLARRRKTIAVSAITVSPELALVDPELRAQAIASLPLPAPPVFFRGARDERPRPDVSPVATSRPSSEDSEIQTGRSTLIAVPVYLAGSLVTSFVFGVAFVATVAAVVLLVNALG
jgi:hypothetical protein